MFLFLFFNFKDMEWLNGPSEDSMEVDIGYVPEMSLTSTLISADPPHSLGTNKNVSTIKWKEEISAQEAIDALELYFFPFKEVFCQFDSNYKLYLFNVFSFKM